MSPRLVRALAVCGVGALVTAAQASPAGAHAPASSPASASRIYSTSLPPLATVGGVPITSGAYGSALTMKPGSRTVVYGLTDRGPNVDGPNGEKIEPVPDFTPAIGEFRLRKDGSATLQRTIPLRAKDGHLLNGQLSTIASTGEKIVDLAGNVLPASPYGIDSEGLVALKDGSFWVSDEYGPFVAHFDKRGRMITRLSPQEGTLPAELANRDPNKGMEGLTITPDGKTLVGIMQAALNAPDNTAAKSKSISALRIVTIDLRTRATHQYVYVLHNNAGAATTVSEITALSSHEFLVDERDSAPEPGANKKLFRVDLRHATDIGSSSTLAGSRYDASAGGLLVGGSSIEKIAGTGNTEATTANLVAAGIRPVRSRLFLDVAGYVTAVDPTGNYFGADKVEGVAVLRGGKQLILSNDSDFGLSGSTGASAPFGLTPKLWPNGKQSDGQYLHVDMDKVPAAFKG